MTKRAVEAIAGSTTWSHLRIADPNRLGVSVEFEVSELDRERRGREVKRYGRIGLRANFGHRGEFDQRVAPDRQISAVAVRKACAKAGRWLHVCRRRIGSTRGMGQACDRPTASDNSRVSLVGDGFPIPGSASHLCWWAIQESNL